MITRNSNWANRWALIENGDVIYVRSVMCDFKTWFTYAVNNDLFCKMSTNGWS